MVTTAGGSGLLTDCDMFSTDGPLGRSPRSPSAPLHSNVLQTAPLAGAQLEVDDIFNLDVSTDKVARGKKASSEGRTHRLAWKYNIKYLRHVLKSIIHFLLKLMICLLT